MSPASPGPGLRRIWSNPVPFPVQRVAIAPPSGQLVAAATWHNDSETTAGSLTLYDAGGRVVRHTVDGWGIRWVDFSPDRRWLVTAEFRRSAGQVWWRSRVLAVESGDERCQCLGALRTGRVEFGPDGTWVLAFGDGSPDQLGIRAWAFDAESGRERWLRITNDTNGHACSPDGQTVAIAGRSGFSVVDAATGIERATPIASTSVGALAYTPDSRRIVAGCAAYRVRAFDVASGTELWSNQLFPSDFGTIRSVTASDDGQWVAAKAVGVAVLSLDRGTPKYSQVPVQLVIGLQFSPTLRSLLITATEVVGDDDEEGLISHLALVDAHRGRIVSSIELPAR